jgi:hypothetical protein
MKRPYGKQALADVFNALRDFCGWEAVYEDGFYQGIMAAGFNRATVKQAFVLAQIVEQLGPISVRGAFYRAVSAGIFPGTDEACYRATCNILLKLRRKRCIRYSQIVDSTRRTLKPSSWSGLGDFMDTVQQCYRKDLWSRQAHCVEVFIEKDAMAGALEPATAEYDVALRIIRGDASETFCWTIAEQWNEIEKPIHAYYLGDHDPAGLRIEKTLKRKLEGFSTACFTWYRLAITDSDFFDPATLGFPIKGDRASKPWQTKNRDYLRTYGDRCVEVDALDPDAIRQRVRAAIESHIDQGEWERLKLMESAERDSVRELVLQQAATERI